MIKYIIEDSYDGILSAIFDSFIFKEKPTMVTTFESQIDLLTAVKNIKITKEKVDRVDKKLFSILSLTNYKLIKTALLSGQENKHFIIFNYLYKIISYNSDVSNMYNDSDIFNYYALVKKITLEAHRFKGFIRFSKSKNGIFYAKYSPDNDITSLIFPHFKKRFYIQPFILHDVKRNVFALSNKEKSLIAKDPDISMLGDINDDFAKLFKTYYNSVTITTRLNKKLMKNYMPVRYWKYLDEKNPLL